MVYLFVPLSNAYSDDDRVAYNDLQSEPIIIGPYNDSWIRAFNHERAAIVRSVKTDSLLIEHVGSTSVPGMVAKPTIDIAIAIPDMCNFQQVVFGLEALGYLHYPEYRDWLPEIGMLIKRNQNGRRSHHALVVKSDSQVWFDYLDFRDCLNNSSEIAHAYGKLKQDAAVRYPLDRIGYNSEKTHFIAACLTQYRLCGGSVWH